MTAEEQAAQAERDLDLLRHLYNESLRRQQEAIRAAVLAERAACAELAEATPAFKGVGADIADAIRARSEP